MAHTNSWFSSPCKRCCADHCALPKCIDVPQQVGSSFKPRLEPCAFVQVGTLRLRTHGTWPKASLLTLNDITSTRHQSSTHNSAASKLPTLSSHLPFNKPLPSTTMSPSNEPSKASGHVDQVCVQCIPLYFDFTSGPQCDIEHTWDSPSVHCAMHCSAPGEAASRVSTWDVQRA